MGKNKNAAKVDQDLNSRYDYLNSGNSKYDVYMKQQQDLLDAATKRHEGLFNDIYGRYTNFLDTPAMSAENMNNLRGDGVFKEYAHTGGYDANARRDFRGRATGAIPSMFAGISRQMSRGNNSILNPGYTSQMSRLARDKGHAMEEASTNAEAALQDRITQGRQWGASGMSDAEGRLLSLLANDKQQKLGALSGLQNLRTSTPGEVDAHSKNILQALGMSDAQINELLGMRMNRFQNKSFLQKASPYAKILAAAVATYFTGGAASPLLAKSISEAGNSGQNSMQWAPNENGFVRDTEGNNLVME